MVLFMNYKRNNKRFSVVGRGEYISTTDFMLNLSLIHISEPTRQDINNVNIRSNIALSKDGAIYELQKK